MSESNNGNVQQKKGLFKFFREAKAEMKKVTWPSKQHLVHNTIIILVFIAIVTVILSVLDIGFGKLFEMLTSLFIA